MDKITVKTTKREYSYLAKTALDNAGNAIANYIVANTAEDMPKRLDKLEKMHDLVAELNALIR